MPYLAAVEVDQRQTFIHQADTLQEIVGASKLISYSVQRAKDVVKRHPGVVLVWPVSGVLRFSGPDRDRVANCAAELRERIEQDGLTASVSLIARTSDYDDDLYALELRMRRLKDATTQTASIPTLPYFVPCGIQPQLYAQHWVEQGLNGRRELLSWQSKRRRELRGKEDPEFHWGLHLSGRTIPEEFDDFVVSESDSYIALIKADVDGLGRLLAGLRFEQLKNVRGLSAEAAGTEFTEHLNSILLISVQDAFNALKERSGNEQYPFRPLVVAGDDLLILSQRHLALELAAEISHNYAIRAGADEVIQAAFSVSSTSGDSDRQEPLSLSCGVLFCKKGFPFDAAVDLAEGLVRSAKDHRKNLAFKEACLDFHWLASSGREGIEESRCTGERYTIPGGTEYALYSRPWLCSVVEDHLAAAKALAGFPRRKLNQLETITRLGGDLADLAYDQWWAGLARGERSSFSKAFSAIQDWPFEAWNNETRPALWKEEGAMKHTAFLEVELLQQILKEQE